MQLSRPFLVLSAGAVCFLSHPISPAAASNPAVEATSSVPVAPTASASNAPPAAAANPPAEAPQPTTQAIPAPEKPAPASRQATDLDPNPNPLNTPTRPEEVQIQQVRPITLLEAIELGQRHNRQYQVARLRVQQSQAALREAEAQRYPTLSFQAGVTYEVSASGELAVQAQRNSLQQQIRSAQTQAAQAESSLAALAGLTDPASIVATSLQTSQLLQSQLTLTQGQRSLDRLSNYPTTSLNGSLLLNYVIFSGQRSPLIESARQNVRLNELELERTGEQLRLDVTTSYYSLQQADQQIRIEEAAVQETSRSLKDAEALAGAGLATRLDVLNAQVRLDDASQRLVRARSQQQTARRQLARLLGLRQSVDPTAADPVQLAGQWQLKLEETIVLALKNRAELEQQLVTRDLSQARRRAALGALLPQLSLNASYSALQLYTEDPSRFASRGGADGYAFGLSLQWNFFDGGAARARAAQEEANMAIAEQLFADTSSQVRLDVEQAYFDLQANARNNETAVRGLERAREALRIARLRFQSGVGTQTDVLNAETALTQAEGNLVQSILGYNQALAALQRAVTNVPATTIAPATSPGTAAPQRR